MGVSPSSAHPSAGEGPRQAGLLLDELCPAEAAPPSLFAAALPGSDALMAAVDRINARFGRGALVPAAVGVAHTWAPRAAHRTPRYTTRLAELPLARA
jgi:DNA polymerase V